MEISTCRFHVNAGDPRDFPKDGLPAIAFMGRSNVGKSSLINRLLRRRSLAATSKAPGRTRAIHFYRINERIDFVDLPGFGYARVAAALRQQWRGLVEAYLAGPRPPALALHLLDARLAPTDMDTELLEWMRAAGIPYRAVLTKIDKLSGNDRTRAVQAASRWLGSPPADGPLLVSARTGDGIPALWRAIDAACAAHRSAHRAHPPRAGGDFTAGRPDRDVVSRPAPHGQSQGGRTIP
jgi:GTP-binding protein